MDDFGSYNIYVSESEILDTIGLTPVQKIESITTKTHQLTGLEEVTRYFFAVTAVDNSGNEETRVASVSATPTAMPAGTSDPDISGEVYSSDKAWAGTTLLADNHTSGKPRIIEVNMRGEIVWEYVLPDNLKQYTNPGFDVEWLSNNNILFVLPLKGVYEIDRDGNIVWSYLDSKISHDADRLPNGNTIFVFGSGDTISDPQVKEVNQQGQIVWTWYARDHFDMAPYNDINDDGWTHTNAVTRLSNGNTWISLRNFNLVAEVDPEGAVIKTLGEDILIEPHDPEILPNGNILASSHNRPQRAVEIDSNTGQVVWAYLWTDPDVAPLRDADRLPNGNTLITGSTKIIEVTPQGEIVWQLSLGVTFKTPAQAPRLGFYKAERVDATPSLTP